ncbi:MAG: fumarylacetoacetate hydrolase family protein [Solirubrobacteraceae bacterium]|nr:fumarylacetoacetate hydrolase family protein [Solirubrobacteraceae bacterium]
MRLATFIPTGSDTPLAGEVTGGRVTAFGDGSTVLDRLRSGDRTPARGEAWPLADVRLLAPVPRPRAIFCIGRNYAAHAGELGNEVPPAPIVFLKLPSSSTAPNDPVAVPAAAAGRLDYEGELVVVMGPGGTVAGYAVADDLSARDLQKAEPQWTRAKGFDRSCPWGPWITTADEVADPQALSLRTWVNGELRQDASTGDLIFGVERLVSFIGETCTLEAGDLILTGTPAGVGLGMDPPRFLAPGDVVRVEIESLGAIEHAIA